MNQRSICPELKFLPILKTNKSGLKTKKRDLKNIDVLAVFITSVWCSYIMNNTITNSQNN